MIRKTIASYFNLQRTLFLLLFIVDLVCLGYYINVSALFTVELMWYIFVAYFLFLFLFYGRIELAIFGSTPTFMLYAILPTIISFFDISPDALLQVPNFIVYLSSLFIGLFTVSILRWNYRKAVLSNMKLKLLRLPVAFFIVITLFYTFTQGYETIILVLLALNLTFVSVLVQIYLFEYYISKPSKVGNQPYNLIGLIRSILPVSQLLVTSILLQLYLFFLWALPVNRLKARRSLRKGICLSSRWVLFCMPSVKRKIRNTYNEDINQPSIIIANHQSLVDLMQMMSISPNMVVVSKDWVWRSPVFSFILSFAGYLNVQDGYESLEDGVKESIAEGCSVVIFPEGQRTVDCEIKRFHRGAFALAEKLKLDILPIVMYGNGYTSSKNQSLHIKRGILVLDILKRIKADDVSLGENYRQRAKLMRRHLMAHYEAIRLEFDRSTNPYFYDAVQKNYTYKNVILEKYMRIKVRHENSYRLFDELIPREASIVDIGCGYGPLSFILPLYSKRRTVLGLDHDKEKITFAHDSYQSSDKLRFKCVDVLTYDVPIADVFIVKDTLHYFSPKDQFEFLKKLKTALAENGMIIVRDGDTENRKHKRTTYAEFLSNKVLAINTTTGPLFYPSSTLMKEWANRLRCTLEIGRSKGLSSNTFYVFRPVK